MTAEELGVRVQQVLDQLDEAGQRDAAEDLVRTLMEFYGAGLARVAQLLPTEALGDELVAGLLVLHELHPQDAETRIGHALAAVPGWAVQRFDAESGKLTLRQSEEGGGCGCGSAQGAEQVEEALACFAPEVTAVELVRQPKLLQIGTRPVAEVR